MGDNLVVLKSLYRRMERDVEELSKDDVRLALVLHLAFKRVQFFRSFQSFRHLAIIVLKNVEIHGFTLAPACLKN